ncbi:hypothetical protein BLOT_008363 [Blomia tropicalis]|nr:hypothetical protein BLOT_008363 [Blomia tropicalis]
MASIKWNLYVTIKLIAIIFMIDGQMCQNVTIVKEQVVVSSQASAIVFNGTLKAVGKEVSHHRLAYCMFWLAIVIFAFFVWCCLGQYHEPLMPSQFRESLNINEKEQKKTCKTDSKQDKQISCERLVIIKTESLDTHDITPKSGNTEHSQKEKTSTNVQVTTDSTSDISSTPQSLEIREKPMDLVETNISDNKISNNVINEKSDENPLNKTNNSNNEIIEPNSISMDRFFSMEDCNEAKQ